MQAGQLQTIIITTHVNSEALKAKDGERARLLSPYLLPCKCLSLIVTMV